MKRWARMRFIGPGDRAYDTPEIRLTFPNPHDCLEAVAHTTIALDRMIRVARKSNRYLNIRLREQQRMI